MSVYTFDRELHEYRLDGVLVPSTTQVLKAEGFINYSFSNEYFRRRGEYVHLACHLYDTGTLDKATVDPAIEPYVQAYRAFLGDSGFQVVISEEPIVSLTHRFGTTPDKFGKLNGTYTVIDLKTGSAQPWVALQTAAQELAIKDRYQEYRRVTCERFALELRADGTYRLSEPFRSRNDRDVFLGALACYNWKLNKR